jgi:hypothetical protein
VALDRRRGFGWTAVVFAAAVFLYYLSRWFDLGFISRLYDKIENVMIRKSTADRIYDSAAERLARKFTKKQIAVLAELMVEQSKYETANYTSNVLRNNQNAFGYKYFKGSLYQKGAGTISPEMNQYGKYDDVADSSREVADWLVRRYADFATVITEEQYAAALKKNQYFGQSAYLYAKGLLVYEPKQTV